MSSVGSRAQRLARINLVAACSFVLGGSLFALGAVCAEARGQPPDGQRHVSGRRLLLQPRRLRLDRARVDSRVGITRRATRWLSAVVLFVGTLFFAVSLVAAFAEGLTPRQSNGWIWLPDILGCVCFLVSGHLAMLDVGDGRIRVRPARLGLVGGGGQPARLRPVLPRRARGVHASGDRPGDRRRARQLGHVRRCGVLRASAGSSRQSTHPLRQERWSDADHDEAQ